MKIIVASNRMFMTDQIFLRRPSFRFSWILSLTEGKQLILDEQGPDLFRQQNKEFIEFGIELANLVISYLSVKHSVVYPVR